MRLMALSNEPGRTDMTDRECACLLGGLIGSLVQMADRDTVRRAVRFWANTDGIWDSFPKTAEAAKRVAIEAVMAKMGKGVGRG